MPRKPVRDEVVRVVKNTWGQHPELSAARVHAIVNKRLGPDSVSVRKVQQIVAELAKRTTFESTPWNPWSRDYWDHDGYTSEDVDHLLEVQRTSQRLANRVLTEHEAAWARRIRVSTKDLKQDARMLLIWEYAYREEIALSLNRPIWTEDLDALLASKPWVTGDRDAYIRDVTGVPGPGLPLIKVVDRIIDKEVETHLETLSAELFITRASDLEPGTEPELETPIIARQPAVTLRSREAITEEGGSQ